VKTSILYFLQQQRDLDPGFVEKNLPDLCASIQYRINTILLGKLRKAAQQTGIKEVCLAGGVSANKGLRKAFTELGQKMRWNTYIPAFEYCTDNAAMIAITAYHKFLAGQFSGLDISPSAR
jgi:N6-L-threonylcarbamoyladenine synthase